MERARYEIEMHPYLDFDNETIEPIFQALIKIEVS